MLLKLGLWLFIRARASAAYSLALARPGVAGDVVVALCAVQWTHGDVFCRDAFCAGNLATTLAAIKRTGASWNQVRAVADPVECLSLISPERARADSCGLPADAVEAADAERQLDVR